MAVVKVSLTGVDFEIEFLEFWVSDANPGAVDCFDAIGERLPKKVWGNDSWLFIFKKIRISYRLKT